MPIRRTLPTLSHSKMPLPDNAAIKKHMAVFLNSTIPPLLSMQTLKETPHMHAIYLSWTLAASELWEIVIIAPSRGHHLEWYYCPHLPACISEYICLPLCFNLVYFTLPPHPCCSDIQDQGLWAHVGIHVKRRTQSICEWHWGGSPEGTRLQRQICLPVGVHYEWLLQSAQALQHYESGRQFGQQRLWHCHTHRLWPQVRSCTFEAPHRWQYVVLCMSTSVLLEETWMMPSQVGNHPCLEAVIIWASDSVFYARDTLQG